MTAGWTCLQTFAEAQRGQGWRKWDSTCPETLKVDPPWRDRLWIDRAGRATRESLAVARPVAGQAKLGDIPMVRRRRIAPPTIPKPRINIAHVAGSGTAPVSPFTIPLLNDSE